MPTAGAHAPSGGSACLDMIHAEWKMLSRHSAWEAGKDAATFPAGLAPRM